MLRTFGASIAVTVVALVVALLYGGPEALVLCAILGVLEVSLSFDNAVVNAKVLERMGDFWQKIFLTVGILIAVVGMRLVFPLLIVGITAKLGPVEAIRLAMEKGDPEQAGTYGYLLNQAHPDIAAFGGMFLLMLFLDWLFEDRENTWLSLARAPAVAHRQGSTRLSVVVASVLLVLAAEFLAEDKAAVLLSGVLGLVTYLLVNGLGSLFEGDDDEDPAHEGAPHIPGAAGRGPSGTAKAVGKAGFFLFLYLEVLDASFSFDGVIGAFAITSDPIIIALGLGFIGAMFVRSITVFLVRKGTLNEYIYLEHGAHWAIGALALILLWSIGHHVPEVVTGLVGVGFIGAAFASSIAARRRAAAHGEPLPTVDA
nr:DUF475 domain-containing protein [Angustibacter aerolatus]